MIGLLVLILIAISTVFLVYGLRSGSGPSANEAFMEAVRKGNMQMMMHYSKNGADCNYRDALGNTPLILAASNGYYSIAEIMIAKGCEVNAKNCLGETALMLATKNNHEQMVKLLVKNGADRNLKSGQGWNARLIAEAVGSRQLKRILAK